MRIQHNVSALYTHRQLSNITLRLTRSAEKISTGYRINRAADDAAGLAVSEKLRTQVYGFKQANKNVQDGISMLQTAEAGLETQHKILQRLRTLAIQAANDTLTNQDRELLQLEIDQLLEEIDRISTSVEFNTKKLLAPVITPGISKTGNADIVFLMDTSATMKNYILSVSAGLNTLANGLKDENIDARYAVIDVNDVRYDPIIPTSNGEGCELTLDFTSDVQKLPTAFNNLLPVTSSFVQPFKSMLSALGDESYGGSERPSYNDNANKYFILATDAEFENDLPLTNVPSIINTLQANNVTFYGIVRDADDTQDGVQSDSYSPLADELNGMLFDVNTSDYKEIMDNIADKVGSNFTGTTEDIEKYKIHLGPNKDQTIELEVAVDARASVLGVSDINIETSESAEASIEKIDNAILKVSEYRSKFGACQNRLEHVYNFNGIAREEQQSTESRIRDADFGMEMIKYTKESILYESDMAMLSQANIRPRHVLSLFQQ